ncbi:MAG TPA: MBL fold metallo-hydrolase [Actinomycetota bacterium]|nr:MBL fold metallo-hydrolase [Actinomycetota bacterium]
MLDRITWFKQSAYLWRGDGIAVYIDPWGVTTPDAADVIFITHAHFDHFDRDEIEKIRKNDTKIVAPRDVADELSGHVTAVRPGDSDEVGGVKFSAVPAYNILEGRTGHPKAKNWVGYMLTLGGNTYYHAGDTDHVPELDDVRADVAFLPIGAAGFTMDASEAAALAKTITPEVAVPMHYGFVEGCADWRGAEQFAKEADPIKVELLKPENPFEF